MTQPLRILLTGAGGFIGSALLPQLIAAGHEVRALYHRTLPARLPAGVQAQQGDLLDAALCQQLCAAVDIVIHLAGQAHVGSSEAEQRRNTLDATQVLANAAAAAGVRRFVFISSCKARFPGHSPYAAAKRAAEDRLLQRHASGDLAVVCLRPALVYGPGMRGNLAALLRLLRRRWLPVFPGSAVPLGMIARDDCCAAIVSAMLADGLTGGVWELHDGERHTLDRLVDDVRGSLQLPLPRLRLPRFCVQLAAVLAGLTAPLTGSSVGIGTYRALYTEPYDYDERFARLTGFRPQHSFRSQLPALMESIA